MLKLCCCVVDVVVVVVRFIDWVRPPLPIRNANNLSTDKCARKSYLRRRRRRLHTPPRKPTHKKKPRSTVGCCCCCCFCCTCVRSPPLHCDNTAVYGLAFNLRSTAAPHVLDTRTRTRTQCEVRPSPYNVREHRLARASRTHKRERAEVINQPFLCSRILACTRTLLAGRSAWGDAIIRQCRATCRSRRRQCHRQESGVMQAAWTRVRTKPRTTHTHTLKTRTFPYSCRNYGFRNIILPGRGIEWFQL